LPVETEIAWIVPTFFSPGEMSIFDVNRYRLFSFGSSERSPDVSSCRCSAAGRT